MMKKIRQIGAFLLALALLVPAGCSSNGESSGSRGFSGQNNTSPVSPSPAASGNVPVSGVVSTPENDTGIGLKILKLTPRTGS